MILLSGTFGGSAYSASCDNNPDPCSKKHLQIVDNLEWLDSKLACSGFVKNKENV